MNNRPIGLLGERPGPLRQLTRVVMIAVVATVVFAVGVAIMAVASAL